MRKIAPLAGINAYVCSERVEGSTEWLCGQSIENPAQAQFPV